MEEEEKHSSSRELSLCNMPSFLISIRDLRILLCVWGQLFTVQLLIPRSVTPCHTCWRYNYLVCSIYSNSVIIFIYVYKDKKITRWKNHKVDFHFLVFCRAGIKLCSINSICFRHKYLGGRKSDHLPFRLFLQSYTVIVMTKQSLKIENTGTPLVVHGGPRLHASIAQSVGVILGWDPTCCTMHSFSFWKGNK